MKKIYFWSIMAGGLVFGSLYILSLASPGKPGSAQKTSAEIVFYKISDQQRPRLKILGENYQDIGKMKLTEVKSAVFTIKNEGEKTLQIFSGSTSCGCTTGQIKTAAKQSAVFSMHTDDNFYFELTGQEEARLELTYKPSVMPVSGKVQRAARLKTNDPEYPEVTFSLEAFVE